LSSYQAVFNSNSVKSPFLVFVGPKTRASIRQGLKELKAGKGHGPFKNAKELLFNLRRASGGAQ
jgi:hypothetical protein